LPCVVWDAGYRVVTLRLDHAHGYIRMMVPKGGGGGPLGVAEELDIWTMVPTLRKC
jgi:hypothetical protein